MTSKNQTFGEYLNIVRKTAKVNSKDLAKMVGKAPAYVSQIENGRNKNPDYYTCYEMLKILKIDEAKIENILAAYDILSPEKVKKEQEYEEHWLNEQARLAEDEEYQLHKLEREIERHELEMEWLNKKINEAQQKNKDMTETLASFISRNPDTFINVINNLNSLVMSSINTEEDYLFLTRLFKRDMTSFNEESKKRIIETVIEEYKKSHEYNGGWGAPRTI